MATITRADLRAKVRRYADMRVADQGLLDTDLNDMLNDALARYFDQLVAIRGHAYFETDQALSIVAGTSEYSLASDFYQLGTVTLEWGTDEHETISPLASNKDIPDFVNHATWERFSPKGYRLVGAQGGTQTIIFVPTPTTAVTARYRYAPTFTALTADSGANGTIDCQNAWWEIPAIDVARRFRGILGLPTGFLDGLLAEDRSRVQEMATERLQDDPSQVVDVDTGPQPWHPYPRWNSA